MPTTVETLTRGVLDHVLQRFPHGTLLSEELTGILAPSITRIHELGSTVLRVNVPFDAWLATMVGAGRPGPSGAGALNGEALGRFAAERLVDLLDATVPPRTSTAVANVPATAVSSLPPPGQGPGFQPPTNWTPPELIRALMRLGRVAAPELATLPTRLQLAGLVHAYQHIVPGCPAGVVAAHRSEAGQRRQQGIVPVTA